MMGWFISYGQTCPQNNRTKDLGTPTLSSATHTINTGDVESITVVKGAVYQFTQSSTPFHGGGSKMQLFSELGGGIYQKKWEESGGNKEWQADYDGELWFTIIDSSPGNSPTGYAYSCGYNATSAVLNVRQVDNKINITEHPGDVKANCGDAAIFSMNANINGSGDASFRYQWQVSTNNGVSYSNINGATSSTLNIQSVSGSSFGNKYRCVVSVGSESETTTAGTLTEKGIDPPSGIEATQDRCDGSIHLSWEWYQLNPSKFKIQVSTNNSTFTDLGEVSGSKRKYEHTGITKGTNYYYKISSYNESCGKYGSFSDAVMGVSPVDPAAPLNSSVAEVNVDGGKGVRVSWTDNSDDETGFIIARTNVDGTNRVEYKYVSTDTEKTATGQTRTYTDKRIENCQPYTYRVYAYNPCNTDGVLAQNGSGTELSHDIVVETTITDILYPSALETSKGYYSDRITLKWGINMNSNHSFADRFKIYSRELGDAVVPELVAIVDSDLRQYVDERANAGVLYEYFIVASGDCGDGEILSFDITTINNYASLPSDLANLGVGYAIGFRSPSGIVNGNITYEGGIAVPNVKVVVEREVGNTGFALDFDGTNDYVIAANTNFQDFEEGITVSAWIKPANTSAGNRTILHKNGVVKLTQNGEDLNVTLNGSINFTVDTVFDASQYKNVTLTYDESTAIVYVNGKEYYNNAHAGTLTNSTDSITIGANLAKSEFFAGVIDEVRMHTLATDSLTVGKDNGRLIKPNTSGLALYWRLNEGVGPFVFDIANTGGVFHANDGDIHGATWTTDIPDGKQLGMAGYTDANGNYTVTGIAYSGTGENFTVTPKITLGGAVHEFTPAQKVLFIGEGVSVQNEVDFKDVSSFTVSGYVRFDFGDKLTGSQGVRFLIDGETYVQNSSGFVETDANGFFQIQVPIGLHYVQAQKAFHDFNNDGKWPTSKEYHDFQEPVSNLLIYDQTVRKVRGRVVGGLVEGEKIVGFDKSVNNIGASLFKLEEATGKNVFATVTPDANSGEYVVEVPPLKYTVYNPNKTDGAGLQRGIHVQSNNSATLYFEKPELAEDLTLDLRNVNSLDYEIDSTKNSSNEWVVDSADYHVIRNFIYRSEPQVAVYDGAQNTDTEFKGESVYTITNKDGTVDSVNLNTSFTDPVLFQARDYKIRVEVSEAYERNDVTPAVKDTVPVSDATIELFNQWGKGYFYDGDDVLHYNAASSPPGTLETIQLQDVDGDTTYTFKAASPEFNNNASFESQSFTKSMQVTVKTKGNDPVYWPGGSDVNVVRNGYILGAAPVAGTSFVTQGPDVVDFILRDPPGDGSFSYLEQGTTVSKTSSYRSAAGQSVNLELGIGVSVTTWVGFGAGTINESESDATTGLDVSYSLSDEGERVTSYTATETFQTTEDFTGPDFDLFVGKSENVRFGVSQSLSFVPLADCGGANVHCTGPVITAHDGSQYKLGSYLTTFMNPTGEATVFAYTSWHIENTLIPNLRMLRDNVLKQNSSYQSKLAADHTNYGKNNDHPDLSSKSTNTPDITEEEDFDGESYKFNRGAPDEIDSVRWLNQQISLWEKQLMLNEKEKVELIQENRPKRNLSVSGGSVLSFEESSSEEETTSFVYEFAESMSAGTSMDFSLFGVSMELDMSTAVNLEQGGSESESQEDFTTYGYTLTDGDISDYFNVKIYNSKKKNGPVFQIADGGVTQCPHEDQVLTKYYQKGTEISARTFQQDKPRIEVDVPIMYNVPADESANFILTLYNDSENKQDMYYNLSIVEASNPDGLKLSLDGVSLSEERSILVPGGKAIQKVLEVERGPFEYDYSDVQVIISSSCQFDPTSFYSLISDTVAISAYYLPQCTTPEILTPKDNWVANSNLQDTLTVMIGGFNINYSGFESVNLEYKQSSQSTWSVLETFYRDTTGMNDPYARQIPRNNPVIEYDWLLTDINDGEYDLRAVTKCNVASSGSVVFGESEIFSGLIDRVNPHPFGAPQPSDGILSAGEEIMIQFNEPINSGLLRPTNFEITGVLNGGDVRHSASMNFEGDANHYLEIPAGVDLKRKSFSIDFYLARTGMGEQVVLSQGVAADDALEIGFRSDNRVYFKLSGKTEVSEEQITDSNWRHYAFVYDHANGTGSITLNGNTDPDDINNDFLSDYIDEGKIYVGQAKYDKTKPLHAKVHELRIWNRPLTESKISIVATKRLERNEFGLIGNWRMEEAEGNVAEDHIRFKHAAIYGNWSIEPVGYAYELTSNGYLTGKSLAFTAENNFTVEFWFKRSAVTDSVTLLSTGIGDSRDANKVGWSIGTDASGKFMIANNDEKHIIGDKSYLDNTWHHFALSVNRITSSNVYIDGEQIGSIDAENWLGFGGSKLWIGARGWFDGAVEQNDQYFNGSFDDIRIWAKAKTASQVELQRKYKLSGEEGGLVVYYPFETFKEDSGVLLKTPTMDNETEGAKADDVLVAVGSAAAVENTPAINLPRPVKHVNFSFTANGDKIILSPIDPDSLLESVILDITVKDIQDLNGNKMTSPAGWTAYYNKNTVLWTEAEQSFDLELGSALSFTATISNVGGAVENYRISNVPNWLSVSPASGTLNPLTSQTVTFTVDEGINLGDYSQDIYLTTDYGYDERMMVNLNVFQAAPDSWAVDPTQFEYSMSVVGKVKIDGKFSQDGDDKVAAFVGTECRGVAQLKYVAAFDQYFAFLNIYSNRVSGENVELRVWDASDGITYTKVDPAISFVSETRQGSASNPVVIETTGLVQVRQELVSGWQWLSFNTSSSRMSSVASFMADVTVTDGDLIKTHGLFDQYDEVNGWIGTITNNGGIKNNTMYKFKLASDGMLEFSGSEINPSSETITVKQGWNWISYISQRTLEINTALANFDATVGDEIKSQRGFAVYEGDMIGWIGSLTHLTKGNGFMLKSSKNTTFTYPSVPLTARYGAEPVSDSDYLTKDLNYMDYPNNMTIVAVSNTNFLSENELKVYEGQQQVGYTYAKDVNGKQLLFITVFGEAVGADLTFEDDFGRTYTFADGKSVAFSADYSYGSVANPVALNTPETVLEADPAMITLFPNPYHEAIMLNLPAGLQAVRYEIIDVNGKQIDAAHLNGKRSLLLGDRLESGVYFVKLYEGDQLLKTEKIIKQ
ncbi:putative secreted protein (Por secretion system target) [Marinoscillum furvescens DSM 4134]|uniref:Putative secreted protein (Por secretion system target) n=2 Tax=Marinoscillum furvescens TaxID=1026 RepID=A0A3D9KY83_MARFU|nr:putative secreted protein (Por secretion system target) [Marinoscillum furvescens DSM 4134]